MVFWPICQHSGPTGPPGGPPLLAPPKKPSSWISLGSRHALVRPGAQMRPEVEARRPPGHRKKCMGIKRESYHWANNNDLTTTSA